MDFFLGVQLHFTIDLKFSIDFPPVNSYLLFSTSVPAVDLDFSANLTYQFLEMGGKPF